MPDNLQVQEFDSVEMKNGCIATRYFTIDKKGLASCYLTASGVGFVGGMADTEYKPKGLPWMIFPIVLALGFYGFVKLAIFGLKKATGSDKKPIIANVVATNAPRQELRSVTNHPVYFNDNALQEQLKKLEPVESDSVWLTGVVVLPRQDGSRRITVYLSDGRSFDGSDPRLKRFGRDVVQIGQEIYRFKSDAPQSERSINYAINKMAR